MEKQKKIKLIVFGVIGIFVLLIIIIIISMVGKKKRHSNENKNKVNLVSAEDKFTIDDMIKVNSESNKQNSIGGSLLSQRKERQYIFSSSSDSSQNTNNVYQQEDEDILRLQQALLATRTAKERLQNNVTETEETTSYVSYQKTQTKNKPTEQIKPAEPPIIEEKEVKTEVSENQPPPKRTRQSRFFRGEKSVEMGNTISAVVHGEQTVMNKSTLKMRLLEDIQLLDGVQIPKGTYLYGLVSINQERILVNIESVRLGKNIYPLNRTVYDLDGIKGISVPENVQAEIAKKSTAQTISGTNTNVGSANALQSTVTTVGNVTKNVLSNSAQETRITIKSNYKIYLK